MAPRNLYSTVMSCYSGGPKFLRNMHFAQKHKKGLKKMQANTVKSSSAQEEVIRAPGKPKEAQPQTPKGPNHRVHQLAVITHPKLQKGICGHMAKGRPDHKAQSKAEAAASALVPKGAQAPEKSP